MDRLSLLFADIGKLLGRYGGAYLAGVRNTLVLALAATFIGCLIGFLCGILQTIPCAKSDHPVKKILLGLLRVIIRVYVEVFRGTPMVLQAVFIYYGLPYFTNNALRFTSVWAAALLVVSINTGAYMAESVRGGIISIDPGQTEGAKAIGMTHVQTMTSVILPQALRNILPQIGNNFIINIKDTSVMFIISFTEFFAVHRAAVGATYLYFPSATVEMIGYLCMTLAASFLLRALERKLDGDESYELVQADALTMTAGTYNYPDRGSPFDERNPEAVKSMMRESLRRQAEQDEAVRQGQRAERRRETGPSENGNRKGER
ncbi:MAG: amino acid ABC transporter permease [Oscillospiraceae bacterium]|nr:amino acid ABC transporter permease [Oscillospiraceae bacterium]